MPARNRLLLTFSLLLLVLALVSLLAPPIMERTIPIWLRFKAARSGLNISFSELHAPLLRPIEIRNLQITRPGLDGSHFEFSAPTVEAGLSLSAIFGASEKAPLLRSLRVLHARAFLRGRAPESVGVIEWPVLAALLPTRFEISADEIRLEQAFARMELRDAAISCANGKSGVISVGSVAIHAPFLQNNFADVRGVARWDDKRLILGSLRLLDGLTVDSLMFDFGRLASARLATEMSVSAFGGRIRANVTTERSDKTRIWDVAGTASAISLERVSAGLGLTEPVHGSLRASKFTFRGDPRDVVHATGSIWTELIDFNWRERKADAIMLGANFYARTIQLQQLYIKQRRNELTLSGETTIGADWLNPDFRGDVVASIKDLGQFAELFGAPPMAFGGAIAVRGRVHARERNIDGELAITGDALNVFYTPVDSLTARVGLDGKQLRLDQLELKRREDVLQIKGAADFGRSDAFQLLAELSCQELSDYNLYLPLLGHLSGPCKAKLDATGDANQSHATLSAEAHPFTIALEAQRQNDAIMVEHLGIQEGDIHADFSGEALFVSPYKLRLTLNPKGDLQIHLPDDRTSCVRGVVMNPGQTGTRVSKIVIDSRELSIDGESLKLCGPKDDGQSLLIDIPVAAESPPTSPTP